MELMKYLVTYIDKSKRLYDSIDMICYQPTDSRDTIVDVKIIYGETYLHEDIKETRLQP